jgi:SAM-dependent methyltransferase
MCRSVPNPYRTPRSLRIVSIDSGRRPIEREIDDMEAEARFWDDVAEKYARKPIGDVSAYERKLEIIRERLKPTDVVLDIGCGTGSLALELAPFVSHVHAVDVSIEMIKIGRRKAEDQQIRNVTFHRSAVQEAPCARARCRPPTNLRPPEAGSFLCFFDALLGRIPHPFRIHPAVVAPVREGSFR